MQAAGVEVDSDSPVLPSPQAMAPEAPVGGGRFVDLHRSGAAYAQPEVEGSAFPAEDDEGAAPDCPEGAEEQTRTRRIPASEEDRPIAPRMRRRKGPSGIWQTG